MLQAQMRHILQDWNEDKKSRHCVWIETDSHSEEVQLIHDGIAVDAGKCNSTLACGFGWRMAEVIARDVEHNSSLGAVFLETKHCI